MKKFTPIIFLRDHFLLILENTHEMHTPKEQTS